MSAAPGQQARSIAEIMGAAPARSGRVMRDRLFRWFCVGATGLSVVILVVLLTTIAMQGWENLSSRLFTNHTSMFPHKAGYRAALLGTVGVVLVCAFTALPLGILTAVFLEEFKPKGRVLSRVHRFVQINISNLAGVPSIVYGIIGLTVFGRFFRASNKPFLTIGDPDTFWYLELPFGESVLAGGLTLMLVILPIVIIATIESLRAVPNSLRQGAFALGCTRWQMVWKMTLPGAVPGIMTGAILAVSRAIGEAAPLLVVGAAVGVHFDPDNLMSSFAAMPLQIYEWGGRPEPEFRALAASGIIVLLSVLLVFNASAVFIRQKFQKPLQ